jgi:hypothetical protein
MPLNPYSPPITEVEDFRDSDNSPALWNPNAAANWSLVFSPAFGAFVHMKNWQALGEPGKAATSKIWAILSLLVVFGLSGLFTILHSKSIGGFMRIGALVLLLSWYFASGREQAKYVEARYGKVYPRRGWSKPLFFALLFSLAYVVAVAVCSILVETLHR